MAHILTKGDVDPGKQSQSNMENPRQDCGTRAKGSCKALPLVLETTGGVRVRLRTAVKEDVGSIVAMVTADDWVENICEYDMMLQTDPQCWLVAEDVASGNVVGHCCGLTVGDSLAAVHTYIVAPEYRKRGIGSLLWSALMGKFQERTLVLSAVDSNVPMYASMGLTPLYKWKVLEGPIKKEFLPFNEDPKSLHIQVRSQGHQELQELQEYDRTISQLKRSNLIQVWSSHSKARTAAAFDSRTDSLQGYGVIFHAKEKWYISPLYADTEEAAWLITRHLLTGVASGDEVVTWVPAANERACCVWEDAGLSCHTVYNLMTENADKVRDTLPLHKVFSMFSTATFGYV